MKDFVDTVDEELVESGEWNCTNERNIFGDVLYRVGDYIVKEYLLVRKMEFVKNNRVIETKEIKRLYSYYVCFDRDGSGINSYPSKKDAFSRMMELAKNHNSDRKANKASIKRDILIKLRDENEIRLKKKEDEETLKELKKMKSVYRTMRVQASDEVINAFNGNIQHTIINQLANDMRAI